MPKHRAVNTAKIDETIQNGGLKPKTLKKRRRVGDNFISFVKSIDESVAADDFITNKSLLEDYIIQYFSTMEVTVSEDGKQVSKVPKRNTVDFERSMLKNWLLSDLECPHDITNKALFPKFERFWNGFVRGIKAEGRGETKHTPAIEDQSLKKVFRFAAAMTELYEAHLENSHGNWTDRYKKALAALPEEVQDCHHLWIRHLAQFTICLFAIRRGLEGLETLTIQHYKLEVDAVGNKSWRKCLGEASKNHGKDQENLDNEGLILFKACPETGYNPGRLLELFLGCLSDGCKFIFQAPRIGEKLNIHKDKCLFQNQPAGEKPLSTMMSQLSELLMLPVKYTNHSVHR